MISFVLSSWIINDFCENFLTRSLMYMYILSLKFSHLYIMSFVIIVVGVIIFKVFPTPSSVDMETASAINGDEEEQEILEETTEWLNYDRAMSLNEVFSLSRNPHWSLQ